MTVKMRRGEHVIIRPREQPQVPRERGGGRPKKDWREELEQSRKDKEKERGR